MKFWEANFDGIVGSTHNYSGLSYGNVASLKNQQTPSNPKQAALQGLEKMHYLMQLGLKQAVLPPQERPHLPTLRALGFSGSDQQILEKASKQAPELFFSCCSASSMWAANAATVSPSSDSQDRHVHLTPANLVNKFHRTIESNTTEAILKAIFPNATYFIHHPHLISSNAFSDEGAANHTRFSNGNKGPGIQLFVFGRSALSSSTARMPTTYPARQTLEASQAIARLHQIPPERTVFAQQNPIAIDSGVFHNDVISVGHENVFLYHEHAFANTDHVVEELRKKMEVNCQCELICIKVLESQISLSEAVSTYFFNSQIVTLPDHTMQLIAPIECQEQPAVKAVIDEMIRSSANPINSVRYFNLRESMRNGGGPACLRLRVVLNEQEIAATNPHIWLTESLYRQLVDWVNRHYRDILRPADLADISLLWECQQSLEALSRILHLH